MTPVLTQLGNTIMPQVFTALSGAGLVETMSVSRTALTSDGAGGYTPGSTTTPYTSVPVEVAVDKKGVRYDSQGRLVAAQTYILTFPTVVSGTEIAIVLATDKLIVNARSPFAARTYRIICPADDTKVVNQYVCVEEK